MKLGFKDGRTDLALRETLKLQHKSLLLALMTLDHALKILVDSLVGLQVTYRFSLFFIRYLLPVLRRLYFVTYFVDFEV